MISVTNLSLLFPGRKLFEDINVKFIPGNCYGVIGANGAGKSTFLEILSGNLEATSGDVIIDKHSRMSVLKQNHYEFEEDSVIDTVIKGFPRLHQIMAEKDAIYSKEEFTDADGLKAAELEAEFAELDGWEAESNAAKLLIDLGISIENHQLLMKEIDEKAKVKVLIAQCLFGDPDILIMDEPTNGLDFKAINWLEDFLMDYEKTVIVVSHDRHFLNKVCTQMLDIDFKTAKLYPGNYDFWYESSKLMLQLSKDANKKKEQKIKELESFIARFSANASKSKQATSRKKSLEKIHLEDIQPSSRKYPFIDFSFDQHVGKEIITVENLSKKIEGKQVLKDVSFSVDKDDKIVLLGTELAQSTLFKILNGEIEPDSGSIKWGQTIKYDYLPANHNHFFESSEKNLVDWLREYSKDQTENFIRGFLGRMLFSGDEVLKKVSVLSGGEKMRLMFSKMMIKETNFLLLENPTNHLDLESIQSLNEGLIRFKGNLILTSHDYQFVQTITNKVVELTKEGSFYSKTSFEDYVNDEKIQNKIKKMNGEL